MRISDWSSDVCSSDLGLVGKRLRIGGPCHRHRRRAVHIAVDDWRLDAARTVALDPALAGKGEAGQKLAEVFHHIVSFGLALHQELKGTEERRLGKGGENTVTSGGAPGIFTTQT